MAAKRNGAHRADDDHDFTAAAALLPSSAATGFKMSQRLALEATRFWARRVRAYVDQMETLASCASPTDFVSAQTRFLERLKDDYAAESEVFTEIWKAGAEQQAEHVARAEAEQRH